MKLVHTDECRMPVMLDTVCSASDVYIEVACTALVRKQTDYVLAHTAAICVMLSQIRSCTTGTIPVGRS